MPAVVKLGFGVDILVKIVTVVGMSSEGVADVACVVEVLADRSGAARDSATGVGAEMNACGWETMMAVLEFAAPIPSKAWFLSS